jgi:hypothetical protein
MNRILIRVHTLTSGDRLDLATRVATTSGAGAETKKD